MKAALCAFGVAALAVQPIGTGGEARAQDAGAAQSLPAIADLTIADIAGSWVEPVTEAELPGFKIYGSPNMVEIGRDGKFSDAVDLTLTFDDDPASSGTYRLTSQGVVMVAAGKITWKVESSQSRPVFPANVSDEKRAAMLKFAEEMEADMTDTETYPIVSYDGSELIMNAGSGSVFEEYTMSRR